MPLSPFTIERFGGLNLVAAPEEVGAEGATDLLNVNLDHLGSVRTRPGTASIGGLGTTGYTALFPQVYPGTFTPSSPNEYIIAFRGTSGGSVNIDVFNPVGPTPVPFTSFVSGGYPYSSTSIGTTASSVLYWTMVTANAAPETLRKIAAPATGGAAVLGTGTGKPAFVATWPISNRLVQGCYFAVADPPSGANGTKDTVFFSDPGAPDTYTANNFVTLRPGDGECIAGIVSWRDLLFVFKQTSVFIFYGESTDSSGNPIFNYRRVDLPRGVTLVDGRNIVTSFPGWVIAGPDAVYFSTRAGIYRTAGDVPEKISGAIDPIFSGDTNVSLRFNQEPPRLAWAGGRLIAAYKTAGGTEQRLVWRPETGWWIWQLPGSGSVDEKSFVSFPNVGANARGSDEFMFVNGNEVWRCALDLTTDAGSGISWRYTSGKYSITDPGRVAVTPETSLDGYGTVTLSLLSDLYSAQSASATLGTSPTVAEGWPTVDQEGRWLQYTLSGTGAALVSRMQHQVSSVKPGGIR